MSFGAPAWFWGLLACPLCALLFFAQRTARGALRLHEFVSPRLFSRLAER